MEFIPASDLKELADQLVAQYPVLLENVDTDRIAFFRELDVEKGTKLAFVEKMKPLDKQLNGNFDYKLVVHDKKVQYMTPAQFNILMLHELKHIGGIDVNNSGQETVKLIAHDIMDFYEILAVFGLDWQNNETVRDPLGEVIEFPEPPKKKDDTDPDTNQDEPEFV